MRKIRVVSGHQFQTPQTNTVNTQPFRFSRRNTKKKELEFKILAKKDPK